MVAKLKALAQAIVELVEEVSTLLRDLVDRI